MEPSKTEWEAEARALAQKLASRKLAERASAERTLERLSGEQRQKVVRQLASNVKAAKRTAFALLGMMITFAVCWQSLRFWMDIEELTDTNREHRRVIVVRERTG